MSGERVYAETMCSSARGLPCFGVLFPRFSKRFLCPGLLVDNDAIRVWCSGVARNCLGLSVHFSHQCPLRLSLTSGSMLEVTRYSVEHQDWPWGAVLGSHAQALIPSRWESCQRHCFCLMALKIFGKIMRSWIASMAPKDWFDVTQMLYVHGCPTGNTHLWAHLPQAALAMSSLLTKISI